MIKNESVWKKLIQTKEQRSTTNSINRFPASFVTNNMFRRTVCQRALTTTAADAADAVSSKLKQRLLALTSRNNSNQQRQKNWPRNYAAEAKGSYWSEGKQVKKNGVLFGETEPMKGQKRIRESWEIPYFVTFAVAGVVLFVGLSNKPNSSLVDWAKEEAKKRMDESE